MNKKLKFRVLSTLRSWGLLCRKTYAKSKRLHIKQTVMPTGEVIDYVNPVFKADLPINKASLHSEMHVWLEWKKLFNGKCNFDTNIRICSCGKGLEQFIETKKC